MAQTTMTLEEINEEIRSMRRPGYELRKRFLDQFPQKYPLPDC